MNKSRKLSLLNLLINIALVGLELAGFYFFAKTDTFDVNSLKYYTILTVLVTTLGAALMVWANIVSFIKKRDCTPRLFYTIRYLSAVMSLITIVVVATILVPQDPQGAKILFNLEEGFVFLHFICPIVSVIQFIMFEIEPKAKFTKTFEPLVATLIYGIGIFATIFALINTQGIDVAAKFAPYPFFLVTDDLVKAAASSTTATKNIITLVGVVLIAYVAAVLLWLFNRLFHAIFVGDEYVPVVAAPAAKKATTSKKTGSKKTTTPTPAPAPVKKGNAFTNYVKKKVSFGGSTSSTSGPIYHISYHDRRLKTWKVKAENAGRALKVFPTQKEAIVYANDCIKKSGGSIRVHSMTGQIRKTGFFDQ